VDAGAALTPAVFDSVTQNVFVGDSNGILSYVRDALSTTGACRGGGGPPCLGLTTFLVTDGTVPIIDPPTLDPTTGKVFVFIGDTGPGSPAERAYIMQANLDLSGLVQADVGTFGAPLHSGAFDNAYLTGAPATGFMWVCGKGSTDVPTLRRIGFAVDGTAIPDPVFQLPVGGTAGNPGPCSPVTEIFQPANGEVGASDLIFFSVQSGELPIINTVATNCPDGTGCVMSADVTVPPTNILSSAPELGGTSGIIIDNVGTGSEESNLYFTRLAQTALSTCGGTDPATFVGCAVKLTQTGFN